MSSFPYAQPREITSLDDCYFYHTTDIPGRGTVTGEWDLRPNLDAYLGHYDFAGKRVLDVGAASGLLSFHMEHRGADVVSFDLSEHEKWDVVPNARLDVAAVEAGRREHMRRINNGYWLCHSANQSKARAVYGVVYDIPESIGPVDVAIYGSILLHLRDPFLALQNGARLAQEAIIVTDVCPLNRFGQFLNTPRFQPDPHRPDRWGTWSLLPPNLVKRYLAVLGFGNSTVTWHKQLFLGQKRTLYTVVARREGP